MSEYLKNFLKRVSGNEGENMIMTLDIGEIEVLMSLPEFDSAEGLSETAQNVEEALTAKGYNIKDISVAALFEKGCLKWRRAGEMFSVCQSLCGKACKDAITERYIDLRRGGDGSESFKALLDENSPI